jgi:hypothetical protein
MDTKVRGQGGVEGRVDKPSGEQVTVDRLVHERFVHEHTRAVRAGVVTGVDERDQASVPIDSVRQHVPT